MSARLSLFALLACLAAPGCIGWRQPVSLDWSEPVPPDAVGVRPVHVSTCTAYVLGFIPVYGPPSSYDLLQRAKREAPNLAEVTLETHTLAGPLGYNQCRHLWATGWGPRPTPPPAPVVAPEPKPEPRPEPKPTDPFGDW